MCAAEAVPTVLPSVADLAALPFLPSGRGAVILILGGLAMLPLSLLGSRLATRRWFTGVERDAGRLDLGPCKILRREGDRCMVVLADCRTCREKGGGPCERERRGLQLAMHARAPQAQVVEVACDARRGACVFEIRRGRPA